MMCSGRIDPELVVAAFVGGADGVMVCGCHIGDCHYIEGNHKTMARMPLLRRVLDEFCDYTLREVDLRLEADNAETFAANFRDLPDVVFPRIFREYSG